jgi:DNA-binding response OmpR family regulator
MNTPIIILSIVRDEARGYRVGVDQYLTKPIDTEMLFEKIDLLLTQGTSSKKVLVVDEHASTTETLAQALQTRGYTVAEANTGVDAVSQALSLKPDMIILNSVLSEQNELVKTLRFEKALENVFILLFK